MKRTSLWMTLGVATLAVACGSQKGREKIAGAIDKPTATITQAGTQTAVGDDVAARETASQAGVPTGFGGIVSNQTLTLADGALYASIAGDTGVANVLSVIDGVVTRQNDQGTGGPDATNPAAYFCTGAGKTALDQIKNAGSQSGSGGGCSVSSSFTPTCNADNTIFTLEWQAKYNCSGSSIAELKNINWDINFSIKLGKSGTATAAIYSAEVKFVHESKNYTFSGGAGYLVDGDKSIGLGVLFINGGQSCVFYTGTANGSSAQPASGSALCVKGANGTFVIKCAKEGDAVKCALWKGSPLTLEGSSFATAPETPTDLECNNTPLLAKLAAFIKA